MTEQNNSTTGLLVTEAGMGQRLDNFLMKHLKGVPKSHLYRLIRTGQVRVNKGRIKPDYKLQLNDQVRLPPALRNLPETPSVHTPKTAAQRLLTQVLYEDEALLIINKPAGIAVHGGSGLQFGVIETLRQHHPAGDNLELVHRLDRETSGCLMVAKKRVALRALHASLREGKGIQKKYLCLVEGSWAGAHTIKDPLLKNTLKSGERMVRVDAQGQNAITHFRAHTLYGIASLMEAKPITGRTHQIRVHAARHQHPIAGDEKYGHASFNQSLKALGLNRLFLHAHELEIHLPYNNQDIHVRAPLESSLTTFLEKLQEQP